MKQEKKQVTATGCAIIRKNRKYIHEREFFANEDLTQARIPETIWEVRSQAFADCPNLESVVFDGNELDEVGENAFANCPKLRSVVIPNQTAVYSFAFEGCTGLESPVFNRAGTVLYAYPPKQNNSLYRVPDGVRKISSTAFLNTEGLDEVILPDSVTQLDHQAFYGSSIRRITIPASVKLLHPRTFVNCPRLETVTLLGNTKVPRDTFAGVPETMQLISCVRQIHAHETFHAMGVPFLRAVPTALPDGSHLTDPQMESLAQSCAEGDPSTMWNLAQYFETLHNRDGHPFYMLASNFWKFFSFLAGDPNGEAWYLDWERSHPGSRLPAVLDERRSGEDIDGSIFCHLGFPAFRCGVIYDVYPTSNSGITLIRIHPYKGDFGESCNYQTTYLDEYLSPLPIGSVDHMSGQKPDWDAYGPSLYMLIGQAISASHERNVKKRLNNPFFIRFS